MLSENCIGITDGSSGVDTSICSPVVVSAIAMTSRRRKRLKAIEHFFDYRLETEIQTDCEDKGNGKENIAGKFVSAETGYGGMTTK